MANIITRETVGLGATVKNSPLNNNEVDTNFINLNADLSTSDYVVDNIAALKAVDSAIHTIVSTRGYYSVGGVGAGNYWYDSTDTTSVDNGGTVHVATDGSRWKLIHNDVIDVAQFGACTGTADLIYLNNALAWADAATTTVDGVGGKVETVTLTSSAPCYISNTLTHPGGKGISLQLLGGLTAKDWVGLASDPVIYITGNNTSHTLGMLECSSVCSGLRFSGYDVNITFKEIRHFVEYGCHQPAGTGGDCEITGILSQWVKTDTEFLTKTNFTAKGFWVEGADATYINCAGSWCLYPLYIDTGAVSNRFINCHYYQGSGDVGPVPVDPVIIVNNSTGHNHMYNCYFDNGYIYYLKHGLEIQGGQYIENNLTNITEPWIRAFNATDGASPFPLRISNIRTSVGFYNGAPGIGTFPGDFTAINAVVTDAIKGNATFVKRQDVIICPNNGTTPVNVHLKPIDNWIDTWKIGAGAVLQWIYDTTKATLDSVGGLLIKDGSTSLGKLTFGAGDVGVGETTNNILSFYTSAGGEVWQMVSAGHINPLTDATLDIGSTTSSRRIKNLHAKNTILSPLIGENSPANGTLWFDWVDDSHFKIKQRGYDGVLRSVTLTTS
ncbi:MAG: hypothetical protein PHG08_00365 [Bacilli bacterium]|nr:hypothetical protein [Bacilli bacterium]